jgi:putative peptidoglycan lipid II flippase
VTDGRTLARAGLVVTGAFLLSRVLGGVRSIVFASTFQLSDLDVFVAAFRIPDFIFQLVAAGALSSALIPIVGGLHAHGEDERAWRVASTVTTLMLAVLLVLAVVVAIAAPVLVPAITPKFDPERSARTIELTRIMLLSPIFLALGAVATSLLNANHRFGASALAPLVYNAGMILGAIFLAPTLGIQALAVGVVLGSLAHVLVQLRPLWTVGFRYRPLADLADPEARQALLLMAPRAIGLGASQVTFIVATLLLSGDAGSLAAFWLAFQVFQIPIGVIGIPMGVVALPSLSRDIATGEVTRYVSLVTRSMRLILFVMLPLMGLAMILRVPLVGLLFPFDERIVTALLFLVVALPSESLIAILARAFYADRDTTIPVVAAVLAVVINSVFAIATVGRLGVAGIGLGIAIGSWAEAIFLIARLHMRIPAFRPTALVRAAGSGALGAVAASVVTFAALGLAEGALAPSPGRVGYLVELVVATAAGALAYLAFSRALRVAELDGLLGLLRAAVRRPDPA